MTLITRILRAASRRDGDPVNVLSYPTHERYSSMMGGIAAHFWLMSGEGLKPWDHRFAPLPANHTILPERKATEAIPIDVGIDVVLSQTRTLQFESADSFARAYRVPHVNIAHTLPPPGPAADFLRTRRADLNLFISEFSRDAWGYKDDPTAVVIEHGVDAEVFRPLEGVHRTPRVMTAVNQFQRRNAELGYDFWCDATQGLPSLVVGDNPGLSFPAGSVKELAWHYQTSLVYANTALHSPVPTSMLEAMACGCAVVTTRNPMVETVVTDGQNGFLCDTPVQMQITIKGLLLRPDLALEAGRNATRTIRERFGLERFVNNWDRVLSAAAGMTLK